MSWATVNAAVIVIAQGMVVWGVCTGGTGLLIYACAYAYDTYRGWRDDPDPASEA